MAKAGPPDGWPPETPAAPDVPPAGPRPPSGRGRPRRAAPAVARHLTRGFLFADLRDYTGYALANA
jgi:hypothetical protein